MDGSSVHTNGACPLWAPLSELFYWGASDRHQHCWVFPLRLIGSSTWLPSSSPLRRKVCGAVCELWLLIPVFSTEPLPSQCRASPSGETFHDPCVQILSLLPEGRKGSFLVQRPRDLTVLNQFPMDSSFSASYPHPRLVITLAISYFKSGCFSALSTKASVSVCLDVLPLQTAPLFSSY